MYLNRNKSSICHLFASLNEENLSYGFPVVNQFSLRQF